MEMWKQIKVAPASGQLVTPREEIADNGNTILWQLVEHNPIVAL